MLDAFKKLNVASQIFILLFSTGALLLIFGGISTKFSKNSGSESLKTNISDKRIYLKDLTTGDNILDKKFPAPIHESDNFVTFNYDYFGEKQIIQAYTNADKRVIRYEILLSNNLTALQRAIEDKLTADNGYPVTFLCGTTTENSPPLKWNKRSCEVKSRGQVLTLTEYSLATKRPSDISKLDWSAIKRPNTVTLTENLSLSKETANKLKSEQEHKKILEIKKSAKAHNDV